MCRRSGRPVRAGTCRGATDAGAASMRRDRRRLRESGQLAHQRQNQKGIGGGGENGSGRGGRFGRAAGGAGGGSASVDVSSGPVSSAATLTDSSRFDSWGRQR